MRYKGMIFDFDYTLGDSTDGIVESANYALEQMGYQRAGREQIRRTIGLHLEETYRVLVESQGKDAKTEEEAEFRRLFVEKADQVMTASTSLYDGVLDLMRDWKGQGIKLGIVTTKYHYRIEEILQKYQAEGLFDVVIGGEDVARPKPDPEGLLRALKMWELPKEELLYVGDSLVDAKTAHAAEVDFAGVTTGTTPAEALAEYASVGVFASLRGLAER